MKNVRLFKRVCIVIMKIAFTQMLMIITLTPLVSATPLHSNGQGILDRKVSLHVNDLQLKKVLSAIEKQTSVAFTYSPQVIKSYKRISLHAENELLGAVLHQLFDSTISIVVVDEEQEIILKPGADAEMDKPVVSPALSISGTVVNESGRPMQGVSVLEKGTRNGTFTDDNGRFKMNVAGQNAILVFSFVGYLSQEIPAGQAGAQIAMHLDIISLDDAVVVGYSTQKKVTLTGSVSTVSGKEIATSPSPNVTSSLAGRLPGLIVSQRTGEPGKDDPSILIRGTGTLNDNSPLVVIDGVPRSLISRLNPEDIESITVLKDASAAIYGNRAANGVILVTTKSGAKGKADFTFSYNYAFQTPTKVPKVLDAATFAQVYNEGAFYRAGRPANFTPFYTDSVITKFRNGSDPVLYPNTDWVSEVLRTYSYQQNINLQVNGGSDKVRYLLSFGNIKQDGNFSHTPTFYSKYNTRAKVDINLTNDLTVGANIYAIFGNGTYPSVATNVNFINILQANPTIVARYPNGLIGPGRLGENPLLLDQRGYDKIQDNPLYSTFTASYKVPFVPGLKFDASFNYDLSNQFEKLWNLPYSYYEYNTVTGNYDKKQGTGQAAASLTDIYRRWTTMLYNLRVTYNRTFREDHHVTAMLGNEQQQNTFNFASVSRKNFVSSAIPQINVGSTAPADQSTSGSESDGAYNSYFGRFNYDFKAKYLFEFLFRYDGSQIFPKDKRYAFFPAFSAGWRLSEEKFIRKAIPFADQLKLRISYGEVGNDRVGAYQYLQSYSFGNNYVFGTSDVPGVYANVMPNPNITWEVSKKMDVGLEADLWKGKLGFEFTFFKDSRSNILWPRNLSVSNVYGFSGLPSENIGKVDNAGFEVVLRHRGQAGKLVYNLSTNVAYNKSKVIFMDETPRLMPYQNQTGHPWGTGLYYKTDGIFHTQEELSKYPHAANTQVGDLKIIDVNGDNKIDANDQVRIDYTSTPQLIFALNSDFRYKNFDLNVFFQGQTLARSYDNTAQALGGQDFANATVWRATDRWTVNNPNGSKPRADAYQPGSTDYFFFDATFVRLKTVELGYNIPGGILSRTHFLKDTRLYISAFNLLTWAKAIKWTDPEIGGDFTTYPPQRIINLGASIKF